jgi:hypothetical protein
MHSYLVWGKNGGILGMVYGYNVTNAEFTAFRNFGDRFSYVQLV